MVELCQVLVAAVSCYNIGRELLMEKEGPQRVEVAFIVLLVDSLWGTVP